MTDINVLLVDNHQLFLEAAARFLSSKPGIQVVGQARSGGEALDQVSRLQPDLVLLDLIMNGMDGFEAARRIKSRPNAPYVIILTLYDNTEYRVRARESGADGFVAKSEFGTQLLPLINMLCTGDQGRETVPGNLRDYL